METFWRIMANATYAEFNSQENDAQGSKPFLIQSTQVGLESRDHSPEMSNRPDGEDLLSSPPTKETSNSQSINENSNQRSHQPSPQTPESAIRSRNILSTSMNSNSTQSPSFNSGTKRSREATQDVYHERPSQGTSNHLEDDDFFGSPAQYSKLARYEATPPEFNAHRVQPVENIDDDDSVTGEENDAVSL